MRDQNKHEPERCPSPQHEEDTQECGDQSANLVKKHDSRLLDNTVQPQNRILHVQSIFDIMLYCCNHLAEESGPFTQAKYPAVSGCIRLPRALDGNCRSRPRFLGLFPRIQLRAKSAKKNSKTPPHPAIVIAPLPLLSFLLLHSTLSIVCLGLRQICAVFVKHLRSHFPSPDDLAGDWKLSRQQAFRY